MNSRPTQDKPVLSKALVFKKIKSVARMLFILSHADDASRALLSKRDLWLLDYFTVWIEGGGKQFQKELLELGARFKAILEEKNFIEPYKMAIRLKSRDLFFAIFEQHPAILEFFRNEFQNPLPLLIRVNKAYASHLNEIIILKNTQFVHRFNTSVDLKLENKKLAEKMHEYKSRPRTTTATVQLVLKNGITYKAKADDYTKLANYFLQNNKEDKEPLRLNIMKRTLEILRQKERYPYQSFHKELKEFLAIETQSQRARLKNITIEDYWNLLPFSQKNKLLDQYAQLATKQTDNSNCLLM